MGRRPYGAWTPDERSLADRLTTVRVRDMVVDCFATTHGEHFGAQREELGMSADHSAVRDSVESMIRMAFRQVGGDFDHPTIHHLSRVVNLLAERSLSWGTPADIVFDHHCSVMRTLGLLETMQH